tara:strand:- start:33 stop:203 length:171 start_codon:yes stop_codon:yes gene_type:complete
MINTVEKQYVDGNFACYRINYANGKTVAVPHSEENRHYQEILEWVANGGTIVDNGS